MTEIKDKWFTIVGVQFLLLSVAALTTEFRKRKDEFCACIVGELAQVSASTSAKA